jgi:hypothetical protein
MDSGLFFHRSLQLAQCPIGITRQQSSQHFLVESAVATRSVPRPLHSFAALAGRRNLPRPTAAHAKAQCQLGQACLPLVVSLQQLPSQIVRIRSRHGCSCRRSSPVTLYTIERNALVPRQHSTGDKARLLGVSKRGNEYLRRRFLHGARSVVAQIGPSASALGSWLSDLSARAHRNVTVVVLANKMARTGWAILSKGTRYCAPAVPAA